MPPARNKPGSRLRIRWSTAVVAGPALFLVVIGLISGGPGGAIIMAALVALVTGLYTATTGRVSWARLPDQKAGALTAGAAIATLLVGCAIVPVDDTVPAAVAEETAQSASPSAATSPNTPSSAATTATAPAPSPSETPDVAPLDAEIVPVVDGDPTAPSDQPTADTAALALLETLPIKGRAPKTGYSREEFGPAWADVDRNGCDTRNDMLNRDLTDVVHTNSVPCKVQSGTLEDPYTGTVIAFQRGQSSSSKVQVDHVVALSDAWQKGAQQLTADQRLAFANDPLNLQSTDGPINQQKGDGDAATWLPPNRGYRCEYVARQVSVKATYTLWVTQAEHDAMARVLSDCNGILAPTDQLAPPVTPALTPLPTPVQTQAPVAPADMFATCTEAANAGYSNMVIGSPGYSPTLDRDGDGVACESEALAPAPPAPAPAPVVPAPAPVPAPVVPAPAAPEPYYQNCDAVRAAGAAPIYAGQPGFQSKFDHDGDGVGCE